MAFADAKGTATTDFGGDVRLDRAVGVRLFGVRDFLKWADRPISVEGSG